MREEHRVASYYSKYSKSWSDGKPAGCGDRWVVLNEKTQRSNVTDGDARRIDRRFRVSVE